MSAKMQPKQIVFYSILLKTNAKIVFICYSRRDGAKLMKQGFGVRTKTLGIRVRRDGEENIL